MNLKSKKKILITGSNGFIGKNFEMRLREIDSIEIITFSRENDKSELFELISKCSAVFHFAAVNRPKDNLFDEENYEFTKIICDQIIKVQDKFNNLIPIHFTSSSQAILDNPYGKSKLKAENYIKYISKESNLKAFIYRLPGVFGKGCKPNYNSVVATFCNNIPRNIPVKLNNPKKMFDLIYIDDLLEIFLKNMQIQIKNITYPKLDPIYKSNVEEIYNLINSFNKNKIQVDKVGNGFKRALYATFLSYLPKEKFSYLLDKFSDQRGVFSEFIKTENNGQVSFFSINVGFSRGGHYHNTKNEKFLLIKGRVEFNFLNIFTKEKYSINIGEKENKVIESIPGWAHNIKNIGDCEAFVILWSNEIFDKERPDTFNYLIN